MPMCPTGEGSSQRQERQGVRTSGLACRRGCVEDLRRRRRRSRNSSRTRGWGLHSPVKMCGMASWPKDFQPRHEPSTKGGVKRATTSTMGGGEEGCLSPRGRQVHLHLHLHLHLRVILQRSPRPSPNTVGGSSRRKGRGGKGTWDKGRVHRLSSSRSSIRTPKTFARRPRLSVVTMREWKCLILTLAHAISIRILTLA